MPEKISELKLPQGFSRWLLRAPLWIYRAGLGFLLGKRFVWLKHTGRKSGLSREAVIEVVRFDAREKKCIVASGWGERSDWFQNVMHNPEVSIKVSKYQFKAHAVRLSVDEAGCELLDYSRRHPLAFKELARYMGYRLDGTQADVYALGRYLPMVAFTASQENA
jgi:deazaflavin-dependent oxidoreductase (nitroreductase family)